MRFFSIYVRVNYLRTEINSTTNVAKAIIKDNASYTLMLITSLSQGKPNTSNYLIYSLANLCSGRKRQRKPQMYVCMHIFMVLFSSLSNAGVLWISVFIRPLILYKTRYRLFVLKNLNKQEITPSMSNIIILPSLL